MTSHDGIYLITSGSIQRHSHLYYLIMEHEKKVIRHEKEVLLHCGTLDTGEGGVKKSLSPHLEDYFVH